MPPSIDELPADWAFDLGQKFLAGAQSCGFTCVCTYVSDGGVVEANCDPCQLVAVVDVGWQLDPRLGAISECLPTAVGTVRLLLDQCYVIPGGDEGPDPVKISTQAQVNLTARWQIMAGLRQARAAGALHVTCGRVNPGAWTPVFAEGGCARWQTVWTVTI